MSPAQSTDTKQAIIESSMGLMLEKGWAGFSYNDIAEEVGIRKASIHYHFPTKEDLGLAMIHVWRSLFDEVHHDAEMTHADVYQRLLAVNAFVMEHFNEKHICPCGILDADFMNLPESMQAETQSWHHAKIEMYAAWLSDGREQGSINFNGEPEDQAIAMICGYQGAIQMDRTLNNGSYQRFINHFLKGMKA